MSQNDYSIADQDGQSFLNDLNDALQADQTNNAGTSAPSTTYPNQWWIDDTNNLLKIRNKANSAWVTVAEWDGTNWVPYRNGSALGTAATKDTGTSDGNVVAVQSGGKLPALDGSDLTGVAAGFFTQVFSSSTTWSTPSGITRARFRVYGAGGGGADSEAVTDGSSGGNSSVSGTNVGVTATGGGGAIGSQTTKKSRGSLGTASGGDLDATGKGGRGGAGYHDYLGNGNWNIGVNGGDGGFVEITADISGDYTITVGSGGSGSGTNGEDGEDGFVVVEYW